MAATTITTTIVATVVIVVHSPNFKNKAVETLAQSPGKAIDGQPAMQSGAGVQRPSAGALAVGLSASLPLFPIWLIWV
jgi:hypothetical protein